MQTRTMNRRVPEHTPPTVLAGQLREIRERAGMSRAQLAARGHLSASLIEKWELEGRIPTPDKLTAWFDALTVPPWVREKIISLCQPDNFRIGLETVNVPTAEDLYHLERFPDPACYQVLPTFDLIGANVTFRRCFPGLLPQSSAERRDANLLIWLMADPRSRLVLRNWDQLALVCLSVFRIKAPGIVAEERIKEIISISRQAPEFERMWASCATEAEVRDTTITLRDRQLDTWVAYDTWTYTCDHPRRPWELKVLTEKAA